MATLKGLYDPQRASTLRNRCEIAAQQIALAVFSEPPETADHAVRLALAMRILTSVSDAERYGQLFQRVCLLADAPLQTAGEDATDATVTAAVTALFTAVAIVTAQQ